MTDLSAESDIVLFGLFADVNLWYPTSSSGRDVLVVIVGSICTLFIMLIEGAGDSNIRCVS